MSETRPQTLQDLFDIRARMARDIPALQLVRLPQPRLVMLMERAEELCEHLDTALRQAEEEGFADADAREAAQGLRNFLEDLRQASVANLKASERTVGYVDLSQKLSDYKKRARTLAADMVKAMGECDEESAVARFAGPLTDLEAAVRALGEATRRACDRAEPAIASAIKGMDKFFNLLERHPGLSAVRARVRQLLREDILKTLADSQLFDPAFAPDMPLGRSADSADELARYVDEGENRPPHPFFDPDYYRRTYPEVDMLRYSALEHFVRYGEIMYYSPSPKFDPLYYLEENEDVLDAGIPPLRHFLAHGLREGRPPCPKAGWFFISRFLVPLPAKVALIGEPEPPMRSAWQQLQTRGAGREGGRLERIAPAEWTGREADLDAYVVGPEGLSMLKGDLLRAVAESGRRVLYLGMNPQRDLDPLLRQDSLPLERVCAVTSHYERFIRWQESQSPFKLRYYDFDDPDRDVPFVEALLNRLASETPFDLRRTGRWGEIRDDGPAISVVSIIYKKYKEMIAFLEGLNRQDLARPYEVVLVDDASPDDSVERIKKWLEQKRADGLLNRFMDVRILHNASNSGNCTSRNRGIEAARADVVLVADGDVVQNASSLSEHLWAYRLGDCDAVIGFFQFDMGYHDAFQWLAACEMAPEMLRSQILHDFHSYIQPLPNSVYNYVTRNASLRKSAFDGMFFDESFNYSSALDSGYGEEDHEIAVRLHFESKNIRFVESSLCVHIRHGDNSYNADKAISNLRNWNRLLDKHPDVILLDRQYYQWRTRNFLAKTLGKPEAPEVVNAQGRYLDPARANVVVPQMPQLHILTGPADIPYLHDLFRMRHIFTVADGTGRGWDYNQRPLPYNARFTGLEDVNPDAHHLAIIPFDEGLLFSGKPGDGPAAWGKELIRLLELTRGMPRLGLCLPARPPFDGTGADTAPLLPQAEKRRAVLRSLFEDIHVVCTSHEQHQSWGFAHSSVIWHGFSPQEYPEGTHARGCLTLPRQALEGRLGGRLQRLEAALADGFPLHHMDIPAPHPGHRDSDQAWAVAAYQLYARYLGTFSAYCSPFRHPAMPRERSEAMLAGVIPVTLRNADTDLLIKNGVNGFCGDSVEELAEHLRWLAGHEKQRRVISRNARLTAMDLLNVDRCLADWLHLIRRL